MWTRLLIWAGYRRDASDEQLLLLAESFLHEVDLAVKQLSALVPAEHRQTARGYRDAPATADERFLLLRSVRQKTLPRDGRLGPRDTYCFHGRGCDVRRGERVIDFDFGDEGQHDLFDAWRLHLFAPSERGFEAWASEEKCRRGLKRLLRQGLAVSMEHGLALTERGREALRELRAGER